MKIIILRHVAEVDFYEKIFPEHEQMTQSKGKLEQKVFTILSHYPFFKSQQYREETWNSWHKIRENLEQQLQQKLG